MAPLERTSFILFFVWSFPLGYYRDRFRKFVYETDSWLINIKPVFVKELRILFRKFNDSDTIEHIKNVRFFRFYLIVYFILFFLWILFAQLAL